MSGLLRGAASWADTALNETTIRLAVTGLSRAGKTVFLTALVSNLLAAPNDASALPALRDRIAGARLLPDGAGIIPTFDHARRRAALAHGGAWPEPTRGLSRLGIELTLRPGSWQLTGPARIRLELLDYPGEWLLDLPLLETSYAAWSRATLARFRAAPHARVAGAFLAFHDALSPQAPADETVAALGAARWRETLAAARDTLGLRLLQPARAVAPMSEAPPYQEFFPCTATPAPGTLSGLLAARYAQYAAAVEREFARPWFAAFDRQILLVDVLGALHAGQAAFQDTEEALVQIVRMMRYGRPAWARILAPLLPAGVSHRLLGIGRVAIAATKADLLPATLRDNLVTLVEDLTRAAAPGGVPTSHHAIAAIRATEDGKARRADGRSTPVALGRVAGRKELVPWDPGTIPARRPRDDFWSDTFFALPPFLPRDVPEAGALPHIGLDSLIEAVIGDLLT